MIKRTTRDYINELLFNNKTWKVLDIGCGFTAHKLADVVCDVKDFSNFYKNKKFIKIEVENKILPFEDNEFDFVIASHVLEHVEELGTFIKELSRISKKGYIELPTKLEDNLVFDNKQDHIWHASFDDVDNKIIFSKKVQFMQPILTVASCYKFRDAFKDSLVIELIWENTIDYCINNEEKENLANFPLFYYFKKYITKIKIATKSTKGD